MFDLVSVLEGLILVRPGCNVVLCEEEMFDLVSMLEGLILMGSRCDAVLCKEGVSAGGVERVGCQVEAHWCKGGALAAARRLLAGPDAP